MLGTNPFNLIVCFHKFKKDDRERRSLYDFEVIDVFEDIVQYVDSECAMVMLEKMRKYWNTYPRSDIDIFSWSSVIDNLIRKVSYSPSIRNAFMAKYDNILCLERVYGIAAQNRRWQARAWLEQQEKKYILVKGTFKMLGYVSLEEECNKCGGFVTDDNTDDLQSQCFAVLENVCKGIFRGFFAMDAMPDRT